MGTASSSKQLATSFGDDELTGKRGPTLGSILVHGPEAGGWRLVLVTPLRLQVFQAHDGKTVELEDATTAAVRSHTPFTAFCTGKEPESSQSSEASGSMRRMAVGCQDGTVLVFDISGGDVRSPTCKLRVEEDISDGRQIVCADLSKSITALYLHGQDQLFSGACGRCFCWDLQSGELQREFHLPCGSDHPATPSSLLAIPEGGLQLWVGLDIGSLAVFEVQSGMLVRSFSCCGPEVVVSLAFCQRNRIVFALSAHKRVSIWDAESYTCLQKYPAELMTCGSDLSAMAAIELHSIETALLLLAGVDGSLCIRRITRRSDRKLNCVLLWYEESVAGDKGCPLTAISYHRATDSVILGDAGCHVSLLQSLRETLGSSVEMSEPKRRSASSLPAAESEAQDSPQSEVPASGTIHPVAGSVEANLEDASRAEAQEDTSDAAEASSYEVPADHAGADLSRDGYPGTSSDSATPFPVFSG